jgi:hypothetical protein
LELPQETNGNDLHQKTSLRQILFNCQRTNETTAKRFSSTVIRRIRLKPLFLKPKVRPRAKETLLKTITSHKTSGDLPSSLQVKWHPQG